MIINKYEIEQLEQRYRTAFINSLAGFRQAVLVSTKSADDYTNLTIFNSLIHLGANQALYGLISRPDSVQQNTLQNIMDTKVYTLSFVTASPYKKAHQTSARYNKSISEFKKVGFAPFYNFGCHAPFVEEAVVKIVMKFEDSIPIFLNGTVLIIGSIMQVDMNDEIVGEDGFVNLSASEVLISHGPDAYLISKVIGRMQNHKHLDKPRKELNV